MIVDKYTDSWRAFWLRKKGIVDNKSDLKFLYKRLKDLNIKAIAIDTEFMRTKTYYPIPCLLQISAIRKAGEKPVSLAIDLLSKDLDLKILEKIIFKKEVTKVFHSFDQDLEVIYNMFKKIPENIADTQIFASFCGYRTQMGYANLVEEVFDIKLKKDKQRSDWSKRPLSRKQLEYALNDVKYLILLYEKLIRCVDKEGLKEIQEKTREIIKNSHYKRIPSETWKSFNVSKKSKKQIELLKAITTWREKEAQKLNIPVSFLLKNKTVSELIKKPAQSNTELSKIYGTGKLFKLRLNKKLIEIIKKHK